MADHPRIRGEHSRNCDSPRASVGSSPHTRGAPRRETFDRAKFGIIPAYAGSTCRRPPAWRTDRDHPRIRGEHPTADFPAHARVGSSPHTRGARLPGRLYVGHGRIIPAYAGSTPLARGGFGRPADHPRIRGEHGRSERQPPQRRGSSPHTRGAHRASNRPPCCRRIIPAYAGSTPPRTMSCP